MINERDENKSGKPTHSRDLDDTLRCNPKNKAKQNTNVCEYSGPLGPELWSKMKIRVFSPDFIRSDFYFFKFVWNGPNASYPAINAEILSEVVSRVQEIEEFIKGSEYAVFYRLCRPKLSDPMRIEILGVVPFFPTNNKAVVSLLKPLDYREQILFGHLCTVWRIITERGRALHPFDIPTVPPAPSSWPKCWPGDKRFPNLLENTPVSPSRGNFWGP